MVRLVFVIAALALLWVAEERFEAWQLSSRAEFSFEVELWVLWVGTAALCGLVLGVAAWLPRGRPSYEWRRALVVGVLPLLMLAHVVLVFEVAPERGWNLPGPLDSFFFYQNVGPQFVLAVLFGVALASGFAPRTARGPRVATQATLTTSTE